MSIYNIFQPESLRCLGPYQFIPRNAHEKAKEKGIVNSVSSCTLLAELGGYEMHIVPGEGRNIKITTTEDLEIFKVMLQTSKEEWLK